MPSFLRSDYFFLNLCNAMFYVSPVANDRFFVVVATTREFFVALPFAH